MRIFFYSVPLLLLTACSGSPQSEIHGEPLACAVDGATDFTKVCKVERTLVDGVLTLTVYQPDGGFRRFYVLDDGTGISAADGAGIATTQVVGDNIEVTIDEDRYLFPAKIENHAPAS